MARLKEKLVASLGCRVCVRAGCGQVLKTPDGRPAFDRYFCSAECKRADSRDRQRDKRRKFAGRKCPHCGRTSTGDHKFKRSVSGYTTSNGLSEAAVGPSGRENQQASNDRL